MTGGHITGALLAGYILYWLKGQASPTTLAGGAGSIRCRWLCRLASPKRGLGAQPCNLGAFAKSARLAAATRDECPRQWLLHSGLVGADLSCLLPPSPSTRESNARRARLVTPTL